MKKQIVLCVLLGTMISIADEITKRGTTAAGFLSMDIGARAVGMGSAYTAVASDASSAYWNPAGVARLGSRQAMFCNTRWFADLRLNYAAFSTAVKNVGTIGVNAAFLTMDEIERTTISQPDGTGEMVDAGSYAFGLCAARNLTDRFSIGFNFKYIQENVYHSSAKGVALDVGTLYDTEFNGLKIGMCISNYGSKMQLSGRDLLTQVDIDEVLSGNNSNINANLQTDRFDLPLLFRLGVSMDLLRGVENSNLVIAVDALHPNDDKESVNLGSEYAYNQMFFIRGGYKSLFISDSEAGLSLGAGIQYKFKSAATLLFDYAFLDYGDLNSIQMFTVGFGF